MATVVATDWSIAANGDIRYTGSGTTNTVIELHRFLGDLMDDAQASGDDRLDITSATASERSTDNFITLNAPYNLDDYSVRFLYDGSIVQDNGDTIYDGITCYAPAGTYLIIQQNGDTLSPNHWTTSKNPLAASGISHRFLVKTRTGGADIDGRRMVGLSRTLGETFVEFKVAPTARGNNTIALAPATDLNNQTAWSTIKTWTSITNTEGYRLIDANNDGTDEAYYSEWNRDTYTINQLFERMKGLSQGAVSEDSCTDTGSAFQLANATVIGQAQSFSNGVQAQYLTRAFFNVRKVGSPTGNITAVLYAHSGSKGTTSIPTGAALATSDVVDGAAEITSTYQTVEFHFSTPYEMVASTDYVIAIEHAVVDGSNYFEIEGLASSGTHAGNRSQLVSTTWTPTATDDLNFQVDTSPDLYGLPGEVFRGVTTQVFCDTPTGTPFNAVEPCSWTGGSTGQILAKVEVSTGASQTISVVAAAGTYTRSAGNFLTDGFLPGMSVRFAGLANGTNSSVRVISTVTSTVITVTSITGLADETGDADERADTIYLWIQTLSGVAPVDGNTITGTTSSATADADTTITARVIPAPFVGSSTGTAIIGGYGYGIEYADLSASDRTFDLIENSQRTPPNNVTFTVNGATSGEDRLLVAPLGYEVAYDNEASGPFSLGDTLTFGGGGTAYLSKLTDDGLTGRMVFRMISGAVPANDESITSGATTADVNGTPQPHEDERQLKLATTLSADPETTVSSVDAIPTDTPSSGTIRIQMNTGIFRLINYSSYSGSDFTISGTENFSADQATGGAAETGNSMFVSYIDKVATATNNFTSVYDADRPLFIRARDGGGTPIKTAATTGTLVSSNASATINRVSDV